MGADLKKTFGHAGVYTIGIIASSAVSFIMLPIYTRFLTPGDYGILELLEMTTDIVTTVTALGIHNGLFKFYYAYDREQDRKELVSTIFILVASLFFITSSLGALSSGLISRIIFGSDEYSYYVTISFFNMFLQFLGLMCLSYLRVLYKSRLFVVISIIKLALQLSLNIVLVVGLDMKVLGVLYSTMISAFIICLSMGYYTLKNVGVHFSREKAIGLIKFGIPFVFTGLGTFVLTFSDRYFLKYYRGVADVGIYSLGYKFGFLLMTFPVFPLFNIWMVQRFELVNKDGYENIFNTFLSWFFIITLTTVLAITVISRDLLRVMSSPAFWDAYRIIPIILVAYFFQACTDVFNFGIYHKGKTRYIAYSTILSALVILVLSFLLIPSYGIYGAAWATLIAFTIRLIYVYIFSQKLFKIRYEFGKPILTFCIAVLAIVVYLVTSDLAMFKKLYVSSSFSVALIGMFLLALMLLKIISSQNIMIIVNSLKSPVKMWREIRSQLST
jgi:O-antigen/teichoic acid export membrane protein